MPEKYDVIANQSADWFAMTCVIRGCSEELGDCHTSVRYIMV